jgi:hypothetical protein
MRLTLWDYLQAAFSARPAGMFVPPNWIGIGMFGLLGMLNPGFWIVGVGCELAYLTWLGTHPRFQKIVNGGRLLDEQRHWQEKLYNLVRELPAEDQQRYRALEARCQSILRQQSQNAGLSPGLGEQGEGLGRLAWMYMRLLLTREWIRKILRESPSSQENSSELTERINGLQEQLKQASITEDLRKSLTSQIEILQQRQDKRREAVEKVAFLDAELIRIQEQVELLREQSALSTDPQAVSQRIDQITTTLGSTNQWIHDQQKIYGAMEDLLSDPPPLLAQSSKESQ